MTPELAALHDLRDAARELLTLEADPHSPELPLEQARTRAAERYACYVDRFGPLNRGVLEDGHLDAQTGLPLPRWRRPDLGGFRSDPDYLTVIALEVYDPGTGTAGPAPILQRRVHGRVQPLDQVATVFEALTIALGEGGGGGAAGVDLHRIAGLLGLPDVTAAEAALGDLVYRDPEHGGRWVSARDYLAGDVRAKHERARAAGPRYRRNAEALAAVIPPELGPLDIAVSLGAPWVPAGDIEDFVHEALGGRVKVWHLPSAASWKIVPLGRKPANTYNTARLHSYDILTAGLNGRVPMVFDSRAVPGRRLRVRNTPDSLAAQEKLTALQERFRTWLWEDAGRAARLCADYNRRLNSFVTRRHDGSQLTFPGLADGVELWPWQRDIVAQIVSSPATLCGHAVGAGKTRSMICAAMTARRLGLAAKPLIAVPAHLVEQTAREARQAYPFGRFLIAGEDRAQSRQQLAARCAAGDWDAVVMSHGTFTALPVDPEAEIACLEQRRATLERQSRAGKGGRHGRSVLTRRITPLDNRIEALRTGPRPSVTFDDIGVDLLLIDEAHYFKRLPIVSRMEGVSLGSSRRAADLLLKAQILRRRRGALPTLALFTGTPWSNTIAETFVWQSFVQPEVLAAAEIEHFDAWAAVFIDYDESVEVTPDGSGIRMMQRPSRIRNVPELRRMFARSADVLPASVLNLDRPARRHETIVSEPGPRQSAYVLGLAARADKIHRESVKSEPGGDNMLALCGDGRRAALDPLLVGVHEASPKLAALADVVARIHRENSATTFAGSDATGVLQVVFCDQGTPGADGLQTYGRIRVALAERGVPHERVRWVHEARTGRERALLFEDCRSGAVSVLLGSTDKLGVGTNIQNRLRAIHHADAPWRPADVEQREGRAFRPGNPNPVVDVYRYVTKGTFDAYMWQTLQRKASFIEQLYRSDPGNRSMEDVGESVLTYAEVKALATGNELLLAQAQAQAALARLRILRSLDAQALTAARHDLAAADKEQYHRRQQGLMLRAAQERLAALAPGTHPESEVSAAALALHERLDQPASSDDPAPVRAPWRGLGVELIPDGGWNATDAATVSLRITLAHRRVDEVALPLPLLARSHAACTRSVLTQLRRWLGRLDHRVAEVAQEVVDAELAAQRARRVIDEHQFSRLDELVAAEAHLADITIALEASSAGSVRVGH